MNIISLFSGCGGFDLGFIGGFDYLGKHYSETGHKVIFANDVDKNACSTYRENIGDHVFCGDIKTVEDFPQADILIGGYPCQGFSLIGTRLETDERNFLYLEYARCIDQVKPKVFVAENVKGLLSMSQGEVIKAMVKEFESKGYKVKFKLLNAKNYGVPQDRERVFIVGIRNDLAFEYKYPEPTHSEPSDDNQMTLFPSDEKKELVTLKVAIGDMPEPKDDDIYSAKFSPLYMSRNRRRDWDEVSFTIQAGSMHVPLHPSSPEMIHVGEDEWEFGNGQARRLTVQECKRIQSFPDNFDLQGKGFATHYRQIGNAVPPVLAWHIAKKIPSSL